MQAADYTMEDELGGTVSVQGGYAKNYSKACTKNEEDDYIWMETGANMTFHQDLLECGKHCSAAMRCGEEGTDCGHAALAVLARVKSGNHGWRETKCLKIRKSL